MAPPLVTQLVRQEERREPGLTRRTTDGGRTLNSAERVAQAMRTAILRGELLPGEHVRQVEWAGRLGVSRGPLREGMRILVTEHLLSYDLHRGYFVIKLDGHEIEQIYLMRRLLEAEVLHSVRWPEPAEIDVLRGVASDVVDDLRAGNVHAALEGARSLYFNLYDLSALELLVREVKRLWSISDVYRSVALRTVRLSDPEAKSLRKMYRQLFACLAQRDPDALVEFNDRWRASTLARLTSL